ncbi:hypothetical protein BRADI_1g17755v3 [Brachypodium distachyon]|uniref:F-box/LRR-repeat protein 15/At3g58940/PEG3-like LRR domain-containing protein n=1 Tax=Brachypodium distachyon TaxID=15368 RepID=A0A0Q3RNS2_BRADI|nr:hypothetical protein BRADI_1g17755v3 [Brachypodium distachyon]
MAPAKEAVATTALSHRWRRLWRRAAGLNLDSRPYSARWKDDYYPPTFNDFFSDALAALAAIRRSLSRRRRGGRKGLKRLTLSLEEGTYRISYHYRASGADPDQDHGRVAALLADPALAALEELQIGCHYRYPTPYTPPVASLPCAATLRVLDLNRCKLEPPPATTTTLAFPCLTDLRLESCYLLQGYLQAMVDAAPALTGLSLVNVTHSPPEHSKKNPYYRQYLSLPFRLRCPTATVLVLHICNVNMEELEPSANNGIELDMPSLRFFQYKGYPVKLSLTSPAPQLAHVDLEAIVRHQHAWRYRQAALHMLPSLCSTRALKLRLHRIEDLVDSGEQHIVMPTFPNLELLDLDTMYQYRDGKTAVAMARLLCSSPAMAELRLRLNMLYDYDHERRIKAASPGGGPFFKSMDRFERLAPMSGARRANVEHGEVSELPDALTKNCAFRCLQTSLRKVTLQFEAKEVDCFQARLAKFLAENAMVLEEMHIYDGSHFWADHLLHKVAIWRADSFRKRNLTDTAGFRVYQLANPVVDSKKHGYN